VRTIHRYRVFFAGRATVAALFFLLAACSTAPVEETRAFVNAVTAVKSAGDLLFDTLTVAERRAYTTRVKQDRRTRYRFNVADAPYFASIGEPPEVAAFRNSLKVVQQYASLLLALAEGQDVAKARGHILSIAASIGELVKAPEVAPVVAALSPIIDQALRAQSVAEARRIAVEGLPVVRQLLTAMRDATPAIFLIFAGDLTAAGAPPAAYDAVRVTVSNFVMLLDSLQSTLDQLEIAYERPSSPATLAVLVEAAANLNADATAARKAFAQFGIR
jgi:hypothetical protein